MKIGINPCSRRRDGKAPCSKHALAHATIRGLLAWYSGKSLPACPWRGQGPFGTGNKMRDVHSPSKAHARQKSRQPRLDPVLFFDWGKVILPQRPGQEFTQPSKEQVFQLFRLGSHQLINLSLRQTPTAVCPFLPQKKGGCEDPNTTMSPAFNSEKGSVTKRTPCPARFSSTLC